MRAAHESVRLTALNVSLWSRDPMPVNVIEVAARSVCGAAAPPRIAN